MGIIQNAMNQMLSTVGIAARLTPGYETKQELYKEKNKEKALNKQMELFEEGKAISPVDDMDEGTESFKYITNLQKGLAETSKRQAYLKPTEKNIENALEQQYRYENLLKASGKQQNKANQFEGYENFVASVTKEDE